MSLLPRVPRPLRRDATSLRDDRLFIIACDDTFAPKQYFEFFQLTRIKVHVVPTQDNSSAAAHVLQRLLNVDHEDDDERWLLLDTDHYTSGTHLSGFTQTLAEARRQGINVALSKPSFELWLLLHCADETTLPPLATAKDIEAVLRTQLGEYNKAKLKKQHYPPSTVRDACNRAQSLDARTKGTDIPTETTTRVYQIWKAIVAKALPSQLPLERRQLLP